MRTDLVRYETFLCFVTNEAIYLVARNDVDTFDLMTVDRTTRVENLVVGVKRYNTEEELNAAIPFAASSGSLPSRPGSGRSKKAERSADQQGSSSASKQNVVVQRVFNAYGVIGFVRFLYGYYILIVSERSQVATVGHHAIFKIDRIETIYIPVPQIGVNDANEQRYLKTFQNADLTTNFFMSYTYDVTRTLQSWLDGPAVVPFDRSFEPKFTWNNYLFDSTMIDSLNEEARHRWIVPIIHGYIGQGNVNVFGRHIFITLIGRRSRCYAGTRYLKRGISTEGYVANEVETEQIVFENPTLALAKMSSVNQVSTDGSSAPLQTDGLGLISSFVQVRGSVPGLWTQDQQMSVVGPPPISVFGYDLGSALAARHFNQLLSRYGAPIIVFDLVKTSQKSSKRQAAATAIVAATAASGTTAGKGGQQQLVSPSEAQKEALLHEIFNETVSYLNQYMDPKFRIHYIHIDLAHIYRRDPTGAITVRRLLEIGERIVATCGICVAYSGRRQTGALRTNCVDCLDRTNTAQLAAGLVALGHQFYALGATSQPVIELDSYCFRLFELLFEEMGDILALQYGGSLLVHHFATYRRAAPWTSTSRDKLEQVARLVNNTFSDADRQHGKNLLLGIYRPYEHHRGTGTIAGQALWDLLSDYDLHNPPLEALISDAERRSRLVQWFDLELLNCLPMPAPILSESEKTVMEPKSKSKVDAFMTYFQPNRLTFFEDFHEFKIPDTIKNLTPAGGILLPDSDLDPFVPRLRRLGASIGAGSSNTGAGSLFKRFWHASSTESGQTDASAKTLTVNPKHHLESFDSSPLVTGPNSEGESDDSVENDFLMPLDHSSTQAANTSARSGSDNSPWPSTSFSNVFQSQSNLFGCDIGSKLPSEADAKLFNLYCYMSDFRPVAGVPYAPVPISPMSETFKSDIDFLNTTVPTASLRIYEEYVRSSPANVAIGAPLWEPEDRSEEYVKYLQMGSNLH